MKPDAQLCSENAVRLTVPMIAESGLLIVLSEGGDGLLSFNVLALFSILRSSCVCSNNNNKIVHRAQLAFSPFIFKKKNRFFVERSELKNKSIIDQPEGNPIISLI